MEIFFGLLLTLPYLLALLLTYFLSHKLFNRYSSQNFGKASRFFFALGIFLVVGFVIRKIALAGFGLLFSAFGVGVAMGALSFFFGMILGPVVLVVWYGTALLFAVRAAKKDPQLTSLTPSVETNTTGKYRLYILVFVAIVLTVGVPLFSNWYFYSTHIGNALAQTFNEPRFCKIIAYEGSSNECVNNLLSESNVSTSALKCSDFKKDTDNFHKCVISKAIETDDPTQCEKMSDYKRREKAECYRNFVGSTEWSEFCSEQDTFDKPIISARCLTTSTVNDLYSSRFLDGVSAPAWFGSAVIPNYRSEAYGETYAQETTEWLKDLGADPGTTDSAGRTLLMFMMRFQSNNISKDLARFALDFGVDIDATDNNGDSVFDYAVRSGNLAIIELVENVSNQSYKPKATDLQSFLDSEDTCTVRTYSSSDSICYYGTEEGKGDVAVREFIRRGWLEEYSVGKVRVTNLETSYTAPDNVVIETVATTPPPKSISSPPEVTVDLNIVYAGEQTLTMSGSIKPSTNCSGTEQAEIDLIIGNIPWRSYELSDCQVQNINFSYTYRPGEEIIFPMLRMWWVDNKTNTKMFRELIKYKIDFTNPNNPKITKLL